MALVEGRLTWHGAVNGNFRQFGQFPQLFSGVGEQHAHARPDDGLLGVQQQLYRIFNISRSGRLG